MIKHPVLIRNAAVSRFFLAPINTGFSVNGAPNKRLISFHEQRSSLNVGINYIGNVAIDYEYATNSSNLCLRNNHSNWKLLAEVIQNRGSIPGIQLGCRYAHKRPSRNWQCNDKEALLKEFSQFVGAINKSRIENISYAYIRSAVKAAEYGYKAIQIHAAHGYFLSLLLCDVVNNSKRPHLNGITIINDICNGIRSVLPDIILDVRFSAIDGISEPIDEWQDRMSQLGEIISHNVDIISLSAGMYDFSRELIYPEKKIGHLPYSDYATQLADLYPNIVINVAGNIWNLDELPLDRKNLSYSIGRPMIADPEFINKLLDNNEVGVNKCIRCFSCHYYSKGLSNLECIKNRDL